MLDQLLNFISKQKLFHSEQKVLLAVSGGIDSMVMVDLFQQAKFNYAIAHCNFKLRGQESDDDQRLVQQLAQKNEVPFYHISFSTTEYAKNHGISIQMAARDLRRSWFDQLLKDEGYDVVATAHHLNDSIETVIFNLARGTGVSGLKGITPKNGNYIRPLLFASRNMIDDCAKENKISWRVDKSNSSTKYHRNLIRHKIIPELKRVNPNLEQTFSYSMEKIAAASRIFGNIVNQAKGELLIETGDGFKIEKTKLLSLPEHKIILFEMLENFGFNYHQVTDVIASINGQTGKFFHSDKYQLLIDRHDLFISKLDIDYGSEVIIEEHTKQIKLGSGKLTFERVKSDLAKINADNNIAFIDLGKLKFPLKVRPWRHGDRFQPLGMRHKKKLSDFMIDEKIPLNLKKQVFVLTSGEDLVWVIGHRIDDRYKITKKAMDIYRICNMMNNDQSI